MAAGSSPPKPLLSSSFAEGAGMPKKTKFKPLKPRSAPLGTPEEIAFLFEQEGDRRWEKARLHLGDDVTADEVVAFNHIINFAEPFERDEGTGKHLTRLLAVFIGFAMYESKLNGRMPISDRVRRRIIDAGLRAAGPQFEGLMNSRMSNLEAIAESELEFTIGQAVKEMPQPHAEEIQVHPRRPNRLK